MSVRVGMSVLHQLTPTCARASIDVFVYVCKVVGVFVAEPCKRAVGSRACVPTILLVFFCVSVCERETENKKCDREMWFTYTLAGARATCVLMHALFGSAR